MKDGFIITVLSMIPKKPTARLMGWTARLRFPSLINKAFLRAFVWKYNINMEESAAKLEDCTSLSDLFLRPLKNGIREIDPREHVCVSPVDGTIHSFGRIIDGKFLQAEDMTGSVQNLCGDHHDELKASEFHNGQYMIIYLSPQDYHRVHSHTDGTLTLIRYLPGRLWPVFPAATRKIESLFDKNERLLFSYQTSHGKQLLAMIGAFGVGRMTSVFCDITTNTETPAKDVRAQNEIQRGMEIGAFALGSTVILMWNNDKISWLVSRGEKIRLGAPIAEFDS